jgi:putative transposase
MRKFTTANAGWLTVIQMPAYAPELNPVEGAWSAMKSGLANLAVSSLDQLAEAVRSRLQHIQRQPGLINGLLSQAGLTMESEPPKQQTPAFQPL